VKEKGSFTYLEGALSTPEISSFMKE
jgi:hypothetical protein